LMIQNLGKKVVNQYRERQSCVGCPSSISLSFVEVYEYGQFKNSSWLIQNLLIQPLMGKLIEIAISCYLPWIPLFIYTFLR